MFDVSRRQFELRKNFSLYGPEDRSRYKYQGDLFSTYSNKNNEFLFKHGFINETVAGAFNSQNLENISKSVLKKVNSYIQKVYKHLFEEDISEFDNNKISISTAIQIEIIKKEFSDGVILELGPGNGLLASLFVNNFNRKILYIMVEAIPQLYVLQQNILKYFSLVNKDFEYCSSIDNLKTIKNSSKNSIILHLQAWDLQSLDIHPNFIVANNVLDQVSGGDFDEYYPFIKNNLKKNGKISIWGGIEKGGVKDLYLFGYGTYHNKDVLKTFKKDFSLKEFSKIGSEFYCLFENNGKKNQDKDELIEFEKNLIKAYIKKVDFLWVDDNADYVNIHKEIFENFKLKSYTPSVSTAPLPCKIEREHTENLKLKPRKKFLAFSYRWRGIANFFEEKKIKIRIDKLTDRVYLMEIL